MAGTLDLIDRFYFTRNFHSMATIKAANPMLYPIMRALPAFSCSIMSNPHERPRRSLVSGDLSLALLVRGGLLRGYQFFRGFVARRAQLHE